MKQHCNASPFKSAGFDLHSSRFGPFGKLPVDGIAPLSPRHQAIRWLEFVAITVSRPWNAPLANGLLTVVTDEFSASAAQVVYGE